MISTTTFLALAMQCAPDVSPDTLSRIVKTESGFNPWAIGVVGKHINRQPQTREEALKVVNQLAKERANFSIGLVQINRQYFDINNVESVFSPCLNLRMGADIIKDCYFRALKSSESEQHALKKAFSCYYSGNYKRGFLKEENGTSYVERVVAANSTTVKVPALDESPVTPERPVYDAWDVLQQYPKYIKQELKKPVTTKKSEEEMVGVKSQ